MACAYSWNTKVSEDNGKTPIDTFFNVEFNNVKRKEAISYTVVRGHW